MAKATAAVGKTCVAVESESTTKTVAGIGVTEATSARSEARRMASVVASATFKVATAFIGGASAVGHALAAPSGVTITPVIPRPCANKDAARKPRRPVISIGRARIRIVGVIAPVAGRRAVHDRRGNHHRSQTNAYRNLSFCRASKGDSQQQSESKVTQSAHGNLPGPTVWNSSNGCI